MKKLEKLEKELEFVEIARDKSNSKAQVYDYEAFDKYTESLRIQIKKLRAEKTEPRKINWDSVCAEIGEIKDYNNK